MCVEVQEHMRSNAGKTRVGPINVIFATRVVLHARVPGALGVASHLCWNQSSPFVCFIGLFVAFHVHAT